MKILSQSNPSKTKKYRYKSRALLEKSRKQLYHKKSQKVHYAKIVATNAIFELVFLILLNYKKIRKMGKRQLNSDFLTYVFLAIIIIVVLKILYTFHVYFGNRTRAFCFRVKRHTNTPIFHTLTLSKIRVNIEMYRYCL